MPVDRFAVEVGAQMIAPNADVVHSTTCGFVIPVVHSGEQWSQPSLIFAMRHQPHFRRSWLRHMVQLEQWSRLSASSI